MALDWHSAIFAFVLAVVCGIGSSTLPALQATKTDVVPALKEGGAMQLSGQRRFGLRNLAIGAEVAGSLLLLLVTGFLVMGIMNGNSVKDTNLDEEEDDGLPLFMDSGSRRLYPQTRLGPSSRGCRSG